MVFWSRCLDLSWSLEEVHVFPAPSGIQRECISPADPDPSGHGPPGGAFLPALFASITFPSRAEVGRAIKRAKDGKGGGWLCLAERLCGWQRAEAGRGAGDSRGRFHRALGVGWNPHGEDISWCMRAMPVPVWGTARTTTVLKYDWKRHPAPLGWGISQQGAPKALPHSGCVTATTISH